MKDENINNNHLHPWKEFLDVRIKVIFWFRNEKGRSDIEIAETLSMTEEQVHSIIIANEDRINPPKMSGSSSQSHYITRKIVNTQKNVCKKGL